MNEAAGMPPMFCPQCGGAVDADARFCKHCAFDLTRTSYPPATTIIADDSRERAAASKPVVLMVAVVCVCMLAVGLAGAYLYKRGRSATDAANNAATTALAPTMSERAKQVEDKILRGETLSDADIKGLSAYELRVLRNVHFARYGRRYDRPGLGDYYSTRPWYQPTDSYTDSMITANDKANINLILAAENQLKQTESTTLANANANNSSQTTSLVNSNNSQPETTTQGTPASALTTSNVQRAVSSFMRDFTKGGQINVEGVQELPNENAATADLRFVNWVCSTTYEGGLSKQTPPPVTYDRFGMPSSTFGLRLRTYNTSGLAVLKRYNDGRWVLKEVRVGQGFNTISIGGTLEVR
jgi:YARHG domain